MSRQGRPSTKRATKSAPVIDNPPIDETIEDTTNEATIETDDLEGNGIQEANENIKIINIIDEIHTALKTYEKEPDKVEHIFIGFFDINDKYNESYNKEKDGKIICSYSCPFHIIGIGINRINKDYTTTTTYIKIADLLKNNKNYDNIKNLSIRQFIKVDSKLYKEITNQQLKQKQIYKFNVNGFLTNNNKNYGEYSINLNWCKYETLKNNNLIKKYDKNLPIYKKMFNAYESIDPRDNYTPNIDKLENDNDFY